MSTRAGRIVRAAIDASNVSLMCAETVSSSPVLDRRMARGRVEPKERVESQEKARQVLAAARQEAEQLRNQVRAERDAIVAQARKDAIEQGTAELAAAWLRVHAREAKADEHDLERTVTLARMLAERIVGESLRLHPDTIASIARQGLQQLWRARAVTIHAHPDDAAALATQFTSAEGVEHVVIVPDPTRTPGHLRFVSDLGELDGALGPQLDRLAAAIHREVRS